MVFVNVSQYQRSSCGIDYQLTYSDKMAVSTHLPYGKIIKVNLSREAREAEKKSRESTS